MKNIFLMLMICIISGTRCIVAMQSNAGSAPSLIQPIAQRPPLACLDKLQEILNTDKNLSPDMCNELNAAFNVYLQAPTRDSRYLAGGIKFHIDKILQGESRDMHDYKYLIALLTQRVGTPHFDD